MFTQQGCRGMPSVLKTALVFISLSFLLSTGAAKAEEPPHIYSDLVKGSDGKYIITRITTDEDKVDLTTMKPVGFNQKKWDCSRMLFGRFQFSDHRDCIPPGSEFRTGAVSPLATALLGAGTLGASMLFGVIIEESVFDMDAFHKALSEALASAGLEGKREALIKKYSILNRNIEEQNEELSELFSRYKDEYYGSKAVKVDKQVVDASGLYNNDLYLDLIIRVNRNSLSELQPAKNRPVTFSVPPEELEPLLKKIEESFKDEKLAYEEQLKSAVKEYPLFCGPEYMEPYRIRYECPKSVQASANGTVAAKAVILSKDVKNAFPYSFSAEDANLKVTFGKGKFTFENRSEKPIKVIDISLGYNGKSSKVGSRPVDLPPGAKLDTTTLFKAVNSDLEKEAAFKALTLEASEKINIAFSMNIKYALSGGEVNLLAGSRDFRLSDIITNTPSRLQVTPIVLH